MWWARRKSLKSSAQCPLGPCHLPTPQHATLWPSDSHLTLPLVCPHTKRTLSYCNKQVRSTQQVPGCRLGTGMKGTQPYPAAREMLDLRWQGKGCCERA